MQDLADLIAAKRFLGAEFLLWLWHKDDVRDGLHELPDESVELHFDDQLRLEGFLAEAEQSALKGGAPAHRDARGPSLRFPSVLSHGHRGSQTRTVPHAMPSLWIVPAHTLMLRHPILTSGTAMP